MTIQANPYTAVNKAAFVLSKIHRVLLDVYHSLFLGHITTNVFEKEYYYLFYV